MIQNILKSSIIFLFLAALQLSFIPFISIQGIIPDLIVIYVVMFALRNGQLKGTFFGFIVGFVFDLVSGGLIGSAMFAKTLAGFVAGYFYKEDYEEVFSNRFLFISIIFISAAIDSFFYAVLGSAEVKLNILSLIFSNAIFPAAYTSLIGLAYSLLVRRKNG